MGTLSVIKRTVRATRSLHAMLMAILGIMLRPELWSTDSLDIVFSLLSVVFLWQFTTMLNDIYDMEIDRTAHPDRPLVSGEISVGRYWRWTIYVLLISLFLSALCGFIPTLLALAYTGLAVAYSVPPCRIRNKWYGTVIIGLGSGIFFLIGYTTHFWIGQGDYIHIPEFTSLVWSTLAIIIAALSIAPNMTAYRDYEGDMKAGASTIYTILGKEKGKNVVALSLIILFVLPVFLLFSYFNLILSLALGIAAYISFKRFECYSCVFGAYFLELAYYISILVISK